MSHSETLCLTITIRTCFYVLGLIATTDQGADVLAEFGWEATMTPLRTATGLCLPQDLTKFLHVCSCSSVKVP